MAVVNAKNEKRRCGGKKEQKTFFGKGKEDLTRGNNLNKNGKGKQTGTKKVFSGCVPPKSQGEKRMFLPLMQHNVNLDKVFGFSNICLKFDIRDFGLISTHIVLFLATYAILIVMSHYIDLATLIIFCSCDTCSESDCEAVIDQFTCIECENDDSD